MRKAEVILEFQPYIDRAPVTSGDLFRKACENDDSTINFWRDTWIKNVKDNKAKYGSFKDHSIAQLYNCNETKPCIVIGSGPSLKHNAHELKNRGNIMAISCLHNFHFLEDIGCAPDFYVSLDAGEITIEEVYEGGSKSPDEYWEITKNRTLIAFTGTSPRLLEKWQGKVLFFNAPVPNAEVTQAFSEVEKFNVMVGTGGNVLGACLYIAKAHFGSSIIAFMGADFCFSYDHKFHGWDSKYDKNLGHVLLSRDVFGIPVKTWQSYHNFKGWFESIAMAVPGIYYNCSEGGTLGAYNEGNIRQIVQTSIVDFIEMMSLSRHIKAQIENPELDQSEVRILF